MRAISNARLERDGRYIAITLTDEGWLEVNTKYRSWYLSADTTSETPKSKIEFPEEFITVVAMAYFEGRLTESVDTNGVCWALWERMLDIRGFRPIDSE